MDSSGGIYVSPSSLPEKVGTKNTAMPARRRISLFVFRGFSNYSGGVLATVKGAAFMGIELRADFVLFGERIGGVRFKLGIAAFAHSQNSRCCPDNAKRSILHASSLRPSRKPVDFKWHQHPHFACDPRHPVSGVDLHMANNPELRVDYILRPVSARCSACGVQMPLMESKGASLVESVKWFAIQFQLHVRQKHSREDFSRAAALH